ncbi:cache domain-containing protein [Allorhizobium undicola]|uniref:cache domain-containing protein n=1 Tax=Allorhizobium undicola TaxID=78527 RepID=UPI000483AF94|nr:cache domain-containing protein [Allorhizobium undicola]
MSISTRLALTIAPLIALVLAAALGIVIFSSKQQLRESKASDMRTTALVLTTAMSQSALLSLTHAEEIASDPRVVKLMAAGDRDGLQALMKPRYDALNATAGVNMLHFHSADIKSFLRVQDPKNFGQDLSSFRPMIVAANRTRLAQKGLEVGLAGLSLRAIAPIVDGERVVGTVEVGTDLKTLLDLAKSASAADFALFTSPAMTGLTKQGQDASRGAASLSVESATDTALFNRLYSSGEIRLSREIFQGESRIDGETIGVLGQPLLDYSGRMIGSILIARNFSGLDSVLNREIVTAVALALCGLIAAYSIIMVTVRALVLKPLADGKEREAA